MTPVGVDVLMTHRGHDLLGGYAYRFVLLGYVHCECDTLGATRSASNVWFCAASFCNFCGSAVRNIVVITRSLLRCQMLFVVFVMYVVFQVRLAWDRTGVNVNGMVNGRQTTRHLFWLF